MPRRSIPVWRRVLSVLCLVLCCLAAPVALVTGWARTILLDQDAYVQTVAPVAGDAQIQNLLAEAVTDQVVAANLASGERRALHLAGGGHQRRAGRAGGAGSVSACGCVAGRDRRG